MRQKTKGVQQGDTQNAKEGRKKKVCGTKKKKLCGKEKDEGANDRQSGRVRRREHKSVALLGWMLTPVRDY